MLKLVNFLAATYYIQALGSEPEDSVTRALFEFCIAFRPLKMLCSRTDCLNYMIYMYIRVHSTLLPILEIIDLPITREIHPLDQQPHRYCMLASTASAPRVTRCSLGLYWSRDLCSKQALAGWGMSSYLGQIVRGSEI